MKEIDVLDDLLSYDPETGIFQWKQRRRGRAKAGTRAGNLCCKGYRRITVNGVFYSEHRLAWYMMTGEWPAREIDHKNSNTADNRWSNLRLATHSQNMHNVGSKSHNSSGFKGVNKRGNLWQARIAVNGKRHFLGNFATAKAAAEAYSIASQKMCGEFARAA